MSIPEGFEVVDFDSEDMYIAFRKDDIFLSDVAFDRLNKPRYARFLNNNKKQILVQVCEENDFNSFFFIPEQNERVCFRPHIKIFIDEVQQLMGWDLKLYDYYIKGALLPKEHALLFNLTEAIMLDENGYEVEPPVPDDEDDFEKLENLEMILKSLR